MSRTIPTLAALALLALPTAAGAADHELSFELGTPASYDDNFQLFQDDGDFLGTRGLRLGVAVHERVAVIAGWHRGASGTRIEYGETYYEDDEYEEYYEQTGMVAALYADEFTLGAKADLPVAVWFRPFATLQGMGLRGLVRIDDDTSSDDNPNQIQRTAFAPGGMATGGLDFRVPFMDGKLAAATSFELGYAYAPPLDFDELGTLKMRGLVFRWGLGARF